MSVGTIKHNRKGAVMKVYYDGQLLGYLTTKDCQVGYHTELMLMGYYVVKI